MDYQLNTFIMSDFWWVLEPFVPGFVEKSCKDMEKNMKAHKSRWCEHLKKGKSYAEQNKQAVFYGHSFVVQPFVFSHLKGSYSVIRTVSVIRTFVWKQSSCFCDFYEILFNKINRPQNLEVKPLNLSTSLIFLKKSFEITV